MSEDTMSDFTNFSGLSNMETRISSLLNSREELLGNFSVVDFPRLGRQMRNEITEFEDDIIFLDNLIKDELFERLKMARPHQEVAIDLVRQAFFGDREPGEDPLLSPIMAERPFINRDGLRALVGEFNNRAGFILRKG